ncbi:restriction endonuclease [Nocardia sp. NPDC057668]|uniref:restriction endonuclease n=1 Tax=Nocardia sp. NPDC057668 TaxID=3346202 RepID=UPI00366E4589
MGNVVHGVPPEVPPPIPRRRNRVLRLFDGPIYADWLFWWTLAQAMLAYFAISTSDSPNREIPPWLDGLLAAMFFSTAFGIVPAWVRLIIRRHRQRQKNQHVSSPWESVGFLATPGLDPPARMPDSWMNPSYACAPAAPSAEVGSARDSIVHWDRLDAEGFERLLMRLLESSTSYVNISRPMRLNAADSGRDIQAYRRIEDAILPEQYERTIVQAKHWTKRGVNASEIADLVHAKLPLWEGEPVRRLIFATSGTFTQDAVRWVDDHNRSGKRPMIDLFSGSELEALLRKWPGLADEFGLTG